MPNVTINDQDRLVTNYVPMGAFRVPIYTWRGQRKRWWTKFLRWLIIGQV
jgi:hypothetical protein